MPKRRITATHVGFTDSLQGWISHVTRLVSVTHIAVYLHLNGKSMYAARVPYKETDNWEHFDLMCDEAADFPCLLVRNCARYLPDAYKIVGGVSLPKGKSEIANEFARLVTQHLFDDRYIVETEEQRFEGSMSEIIAMFEDDNTEVIFD